VLLAELHASVELAEQGVYQLEAARVALQKGGYQSFAAYYESKLPRAYALIELLKNARSKPPPIG
jgi:hypothetical protein